MPAGLDPASIKITEPTIASQFANSPLMAAFTLEPDGTTFLMPLTVTLEIASVAAGLPELVLISGVSGELLPTTVELDPDTGGAVVSAPIGHFSTLVAYAGNVKATIANSGDHAVDAPFDVTVTISRERESLFVPLDETEGTPYDQLESKILNYLGHSATYGTLSIKPGAFIQDGYLSPSLPDPAPNSVITINDEAFSFSQRFTCHDPGTTKVTYIGATEQALSSSNGLLTLSAGNKSLRFRVSTRQFRCTANVPTPSPSRSPSPGPSASSGNTIRIEPLGAVVRVGESIQLTKVEHYPDGSTVDQPPYDPLWTSADPSTATLSEDGHLTGVKTGQVNINVQVPGAQPFYSLINVLPADADCPPNLTGSVQGMVLLSDPGEHADEFAIDPPNAGWQLAIDNGEINFSDGPGPFKEASGTFAGCNYVANGILDYTGIFDGLPFTIEGSYDGSGGFRTELIVGQNGELGSPPTVYGN